MDAVRKPDRIAIHISVLVLLYKCNICGIHARKIVRHYYKVHNVEFEVPSPTSAAKPMSGAMSAALPLTKKAKKKLRKGARVRWLKAVKLMVGKPSSRGLQLSENDNSLHTWLEKVVSPVAGNPDGLEQLKDKGPGWHHGGE